VIDLERLADRFANRVRMARRWHHLADDESIEAWVFTDATLAPLLGDDALADALGDMLADDLRDGRRLDRLRAIFGAELVDGARLAGGWR
jgi:hypothetical protein